MQEIWKDIEGYNGLYQVSNLGRVKSLERKVNQGKYGHQRIVAEKILSPNDNGNGYLQVGLMHKGKRKQHYIHRLVATYFIKNENNYKYVNHKDYDTYNNRFDNLEWCTQKQNICYSAQRMRKPHKQWKISSTGEKHIYFRNKRYRLCIKGIIDKTFPTLAEAINAREVILSGE